MNDLLNNLKNLPIAVKLGVAILVTSLLPMLGASYYNLSGSLDAVKRTETRNLEQLAVGMANQVSQLIQDYKNLAAFVSTQDELIKLLEQPTIKELKEDALGKFNSLVTSHPDVELLMALDNDGNVLVSSDPELVGKNFKFRDYFREAVQGRSHVTSIIVGAVAGNAGMFYGAPIRNLKGVVRGVAVLKVKGESVGQIVLQSARDKQLTFIVDSDGVLIYHRDKSLLYQSLVPLADAVQKRIAEDKRFRRDRIESINVPELAQAMIGAREPGTVLYSVNEERKIAGYAPIKTHSWVVGISEPEQVFAEPLHKLFVNSIISLLLVGVVVTLLAWLFARTLVEPLKKLTQCAAAVEREDYDNARAVVDRDDEIGKLAQTFNKMLAGVREREKVKDVFGRMVSPEVREKLLAGSLSLGGEKMRVSVIFSDIRGFSTLSEQMSPQDVVSFLNEYLTEMSQAAKNWGGNINNFIGDAIVVVFGAPMSQEDTEWNAVCAALEMRDRLHALNMRRRSLDEAPIDNGVGISTGVVVAGQMGSPDRFLYTVIGDAVNVAARLEALTRNYPEHPVLMNRATYDAIKERAAETLKIDSLGMLEVKGKREKVDVYGIVER